jgi:cobyrinic acid a,c-diamide synthase
MNGMIIAGTQSGVGKTTFSLGIMAAYRRRRLAVQPFKIGPDFIDPSHHREVCGTASRNLDGWILSKERNLEIFWGFASRADVAVVEGVMGLYDGHGEGGEAGSSAEMAKWLDLPVFLVVDARGMARSGAAMVLGYRKFDPSVRLAGVLLNRIGSDRHRAMLTDAILETTGLPVLGALPREETISLPERHLGLVPAGEIKKDPDWIDRLADRIEAHVDLDALLRLSKMTTAATAPSMIRTVTSDSKKKKIRIGVAQDEAFSFYYPENLEALEEAGAEIACFSPLNDRSLPEDLSGLYLGGGYPEVYAARLEENRGLRAEIRRAIEGGLPTYAECGGLMYLTEAIETLDGKRFEMAGVLPDRARMLPKRKALGYAEVRLLDNDLLGAAGTFLRGHEFHYSELVAGLPGLTRRYEVQSRSGASRKEGFSLHRLLASYIHLRFDSAPNAAERFVQTLQSGCSPR